MAEPFKKSHSDARKSAKTIVVEDISAQCEKFRVSANLPYYVHPTYNDEVAIGLTNCQTRLTEVLAAPLEYGNWSISEYLRWRACVDRNFTSRRNCEEEDEYKNKWVASVLAADPHNRNFVPKK